MTWKGLAIGVCLLVLGMAAGNLMNWQRGSKSGIENVQAATCTAHGVVTDVCTRCHPELIPEFKAAADWCAGHGVPETQCALCNPDLMAKGVVPVGQEQDPHAGYDHGPGEHQDVAEVEPVVALAHDHYPGLSVIYRTNQPLCPTDEATIQFASIETAERAGLVTRTALTVPLEEQFEAPAEVVFDQNVTVTLTSTLSLSVKRWTLEPGSKVRAGKAIAVVESPDMAMLQGEYLEAYSDWQIHERDRRRAAEMIERRLIDSAAYDRATADAVAADARRVQCRSRLELAGLASNELDELRVSQTPSSEFTLRATIDGVLLDRIAPLGRVLEPGSDLAQLGDPSALWIEARLRESDLPRVELGQIVAFTADGGALDRAEGTIIWISPFLDPHSRTITVRIKPTVGVESLRAHEFGRVSVSESHGEAAIMVPRDAVQWEGCCNIVFVREAPDRFRPRKVTLGQGTNGYYRIMDGVQSGDEVVVQGSFLLRTELKKGSIGAGCCGLEASS